MPDPEYRKIEPFAELSHFTIHDDSVKMLGYKFCLSNHLVILGEVDPDGAEPVTLGMLCTDDLELKSLVERNLDRPLKPVRLNAHEIRKALDIGYGIYEGDRHRFKLELEPVKKVSFDPDNRTTELIDELLGRAITLQASDIHIENYDGDVDLRYRIDGILHQMNTPVNKDNVRQVISRLKLLAGLDITEKRTAQDGRIMATFQIRDRERGVDFRLSTLPGPFGEDAVMRILDSDKLLISLEDLGMSGGMLTQFRHILNNPEGLFLVTGPTGSGKTTTLYSALSEVNSHEKKILTVEDPIEYTFPKTNQKQIGHMSFAEYTRAFMRQDPDIILVGEIRDLETAGAAIRAAQTGHLVLGTTHTIDSTGAVPRLGVLGIEPNLIADALLGSVSQRLLRRVCKACGVQVEPNRQAEEMFEMLGESFPLQQGEGCGECRYSGYIGRVGVYELFMVSEQTADLIARDMPRFKVRRCARKQGMSTLFEEALVKVRAGVTTFEEVVRTIPRRTINESVQTVSE